MGVARHIVGGALENQGVDVVVGVLSLDLIECHRDIDFFFNFFNLIK